MPQIIYTHPIDAKHATTIGGKLLHPGDTRMVDAALVPAGQADRATSTAGKPAAPPVERNMAALQADTVKVITGQLPKLASEQLAELLTIERAQDKPRSGVTQAIEEEQLKRTAADEQPGDAALAELRDKSVEDITDVLPTLEMTELDRLQHLESEADDPRSTLLDAIGAERSHRQGAE